MPCRARALERSDPDAAALRDRARRGPAAAASGANVAFSAGEATPRQFGPTMRMPVARQYAASRRRRSRPASSSKPAEMTSSALTPLAAQSRATCSTSSGATATTASSTGPADARRATRRGRSGTRARRSSRGGCPPARRRPSPGAATRRSRRSTPAAGSGRPPAGGRHAVALLEPAGRLGAARGRASRRTARPARSCTWTGKPLSRKTRIIARLSGRT